MHAGLQLKCYCGILPQSAEQYDVVELHFYIVHLQKRWKGVDYEEYIEGKNNGGKYLGTEIHRVI